MNIAFSRLEEGYENALKDYFKKQVCTYMYVRIYMYIRICICMYVHILCMYANMVHVLCQSCKPMKVCGSTFVFVSLPT